MSWPLAGGVNLRRSGTAALVVSAVLALVTGACGGSSKPTTGSTSGTGSTALANKTPYQVAFVDDVSGADSSYGVQTQAAVTTALKEINDAGGVNGHPIDIQTYDTQSTPTTAEAVLRQALATNPTAVTGLITSAEEAAVAPVLVSAGLPVVTSGSPITTLMNQPFWFTVSTAGPQVAAGVVNGMKTLLNGSLAGKKIAFEGYASPAVDTNLAAIQSLVQADGGSVTPVIRDPLTITSWSSQAANVAAAKPDGIIINHTEAATTTVAKALAVAGVKIPAVSTDGANSDTMLQAIDSPNFRSVRETVEPASGSALYNAVQSAGVPVAESQGPFFGKAYGAIFVIADTLKKCGFPCSPSSFDSTLLSIGTFNVPNNALLAPLQFTSSLHAGITEAQLFGWNASSSTAEAYGSPFKITG